MSNPKWLIFIFSIWITLTIIGTIMEAAWFESGSEETIMSSLLALPVFTEGGSVIGTVMSADTYAAIYSAMSLNFAFFTGGTVIIRWLVFLPIAVTFSILFLFFIMSHIPVIGRGTS